MMKIIKRHKEQRGLALVVVLWVITIMTLLVASFSTIVKTNIVIAGTEANLTQHSTLIDAGVDIAVFRILNKATQKLWLHPDKGQKVTFENKILNIRIINTSGLIDLNKTDGKLLLDFVKRYARDSDQAKNVVASILARRPDKKGEQKQQTSGLPVKKNSNIEYSFSDINELMTVPGMTQELYKKINPFITVHNAQGKINPASAPYEVLLSVPGLSKPGIAGLLKRRTDNPDDKKIYSDAITRSGGILSVGKNNVFVVYITSPWAQTKKLVGRRYIIATKLDDQEPYRLLSWSEFSE